MEKLYMCSVISTIDGAVNTNLLFTGKEETTIAEAEKRFVDMIKDEIDAGVSEYELEDMISNGYATSGNLCICLNHPRVITV